MKKMLLCLVSAAVLVAMTGASYGAIGWAGNIWPVHEHTVPDNADVGVYLQIWKGGYTDSPGQGDSISATLYYGPNGGPYTSVAMSYNTDIGDNDEYQGFIPSTALAGQTEIWFHCEAFDSTDASTYTGAQDQNSIDPPFKLNITAVLDRDVTVYFSMCLPPDGDPNYVPVPGDVCITGSAPPLTDWGTGVLMMQPCAAYSPSFYQVGITFPAGSSPYIEYKYRTNDCMDWEPGGNHSITIDDSAPEFIIPWIDHYSWYEGADCPPCGVGTEHSTWGKIKTIYR